MPVLINRASYVFALIVLLVSWILFYKETGMFFKSFIGAAIAAGIGFAAYVLVRWLVLALRRN